MKRKLCVVMAVLMLLIASGCGGEKKGGEATVGKATGGETTTRSEGGQQTVLLEPMEEREVIDVSIGNSYTAHDGNEVEKVLEERFRLNITPITVNVDSVEAYQLMAASGDLPDVIQFGNFSLFQKFADQGLLAEIPLDLYKQYSPKLYQVTMDFDPNLIKVSMRNGKLYSYPFPWTTGHYYKAVGIRKDWLDNVGLGIPRTIDELEEALKRFRNNDPDGNREKDTYGLSGAGSIIGGNDYVFGAFGAWPNIFIEKDGKVVRGEVQPEVKDALAKLHDWYNKELIDPEFVTNSGDTYFQKWVNSKFGMTSQNFGRFWPANWYYDGGYHDQLKAVTPTAEVIMIPPITGPNGDKGVLLNSGHVLETIFSAGVDLKKMARVLEMVDTIATDPELLALTYYGKEGVTFKKTDKGIEYIPPYDVADNRDKFGCYFYALMTDYEVYNELVMPESEKWRIEEVKSMAAGKWDVLMGYPLDSWAEYGSVLSDLVNSNYIDFVIGARPLEEFDMFVQEWRDAGGDAVEEEGNRVYLEFFKK
jgi:putative aldouronate transport system substrate-binding protein